MFRSFNSANVDRVGGKHSRLCACEAELLQESQVPCHRHQERGPA
jgi:hypothetical protein